MVVARHSRTLYKTRVLEGDSLPETLRERGYLRAWVEVEQWVNV